METINEIEISRLLHQHLISYMLARPVDLKSRNENIVFLLRNPGEAGKFLRSEINNCGGFITQHLIWSLQQLDIVEYETFHPSPLIFWSSAKHYCSTQNTIKLFKRFLISFLPKCSSGVISQGTEDDTHVFIDPLSKQKTPSIEDAGVLMTETFYEYLNILDVLSEYTVTVRAGSTQVQLHLSPEELRGLRTWLCFACNCCMHEKMFVDFFKRV